MSDCDVFQFDFGVAPDAPDAALRVFRAIAAGQPPQAEDLAAFRLGGFLDPGMMLAGRAHLGAPVVVWETGVVNNPANPYHAPMPTSGVRFSFAMHDDHYSNGGYILPFVVFDLVGEHGLFGFRFGETARAAITLYFREFDDLIVQTVSAPGMAYPLPPHAAQNPKAYLRGWKPATATDFSLGDFSRIGPAERRRIIAEADAMFGPNG